MFFTTMEAEGEGWDPIKAIPLPPLPHVIYYWPYQGGTFIMVLFVKYSVVFHLQGPVVQS